MKKIILAGLLAGAAVALAPVASAETGPNPQLDQLCTHPAFKQPAPVAVVNGAPVQNQLVGLRAQNGYCTTLAVHPADYGDGPDLP